MSNNDQRLDSASGEKTSATDATVKGTRSSREAIDSPYFHRMQRRHFLLFDVLPFLGTLAALCLLFVRPLTAIDIGLFSVMWLLTGLGISVGFHRLFCHRAFKTTASLRILFAILGCMAARGSTVSWTAQHRRHHELADRSGDVHSPNLHGRTLSGRLRGWVHSQITWARKHKYPNVVRYVPDLLGDKLILKVDKMYNRWILLGLIFPGVLGGLLSHSLMGALSGFLWGGVVRLFVVSHQISAINSFNHMFGTRAFMMQDNSSHNIALFGIFSWGEGWHNNHHAFPGAASFGLTWYQIDPGYYVIRLLEMVGLAWDVRRPSSEDIEARKRRLIESVATGSDIGSRKASFRRL